MTHNQIAYWQLQETKSHNSATRAETARTNRANEALKHAANTETQRHNTVVESIDQYNALEKSRSNRANEAETHRSNVAREYETHRSNVAHEKETNRHNLAQEGYADREVSVKEALLPSEIARNYGSAVGSGSKLITGLSNVLGASGPLYTLYSMHRNKNKNDKSDSNSSGTSGGSSSTKSSHVVNGINHSLGRIIVPTNDKLSDVTNKVQQDLRDKANQRSSGGSFGGNKPDRGTRSKDTPILDAALNTALATATRVALAPYLGPAASGVAAAMPYVANKLSNLITP